MNLSIVKSLISQLPPGFYGANMYDEAEIQAATRVIFNQSPFRYYGRKCTSEALNLEREALAFYGVDFAAATNSGSGALMLAMHALGVGPGDEVIVPAYFWIALSNAILLRGAIPVVCEIDDALGLDPEDLTNKVSSKTKCVIVAHMFGGQADMQAIRAVCSKNSLSLIEDFSQCNGASIDGRKVGSLGDIGVTSLQINKAITCGEGGLLTTNDEEWYNRTAARADLGYGRDGGISSTSTQNSSTTVGEGRRLSDLAAAVIRVQLRKLPQIVESMLNTKRRIVGALALPDGTRLRPVIDEVGDHGSSVVIIFSSEGQAREFVDAGRRIIGEDLWFASRMIDTGQHVYYNCSNLVQKMEALPGGFPWTHPANAGDYSYEKGTCPNSDSILARSAGFTIRPDQTGLQTDAMTEVVNLALAEV